MAIQAKKKPVIKKGEGYIYIPDTFAEHKVANFHEIDDPQELLQLVKPFEYRGRKFITFDTETHPHFRSSHDVPPSVVRRWVGTGKKATPQDYPFCISICDGTNAFTLYDSVENGFQKMKGLRELFEDPSIEKIAHNTKFDMHMFANAGLKIVGKLHDTVVLSKLANENRTSFALRDLAAKKKGGIIKFEYMVDTYKQMAKVNDYRQIPRELLTQYANADVWNCFLTFVHEYDKLAQDDLEQLYDNELELMIALYAAERYGMKLDKEYEVPLKSELQQLTDDAERIIYETCNSTFNINSGAQIYKMLVASGVKEDWIKRTDKGNPILDKNALNELADVYEVDIVKKILEFRKYEKLLGTYAEGIYEQHDAANRVHCSVNQTEATTGRMSVTKPALQTLPKKDKRIRSAFLPEDGDTLWFMDLDQVEYRLFAHYAKAHGLLEAIHNGFDVHQATAAIIFRKEIDNVSDEERALAKTTNFALIYGQGNDHTAKMLKMNVSEAVQFKANYFAQIPEAKPFIDTVHAVVRTRGFVKNLYGRRRRLTSDEAYKSPNALIQGCAADYIKNRMVGIYKYLVYNKLKSQMKLVVHDELVFSVKPDESHIVPELRWLLSDFTTFRCPISAGVEYGNPSWGQKVEPENIGFKEPEDKGFMNYNVFDGHVFDINKEAAY